MSHLHQLITLGMGTPADIPHFLTLGVSLEVQTMGAASGFTGMLGANPLGAFLLGAGPTATPAPTVLGPIDVIGLTRRAATVNGLADGKPRVSGLRASQPTVTGWEQH